MYGRGAQSGGENYKQIVSKFSPLVFTGVGTVRERSGALSAGYFPETEKSVNESLMHPVTDSKRQDTA